MTEEEARKTRCCGPQGCGKVQDYDVHRNSVGDTIGQSFLRFCIGSACMAWRRLPRPEYDPDVQRQYHGSSLEDIEGMNLSAGYCGLAGKP